MGGGGKQELVNLISSSQMGWKEKGGSETKNAIVKFLSHAMVRDTVTAAGNDLYRDHMLEKGYYDDTDTVETQHWDGMMGDGGNDVCRGGGGGALGIPRLHVLALPITHLPSTSQMVSSTCNVTHATNTRDTITNNKSNSKNNSNANSNANSASDLSVVHIDLFSIERSVAFSLFYKQALVLQKARAKNAAVRRWGVAGAVNILYALDSEGEGNNDTAEQRRKLRLEALTQSPTRYKLTSPRTRPKSAPGCRPDIPASRNKKKSNADVGEGVGESRHWYYGTKREIKDTRMTKDMGGKGLAEEVGNAAARSNEIGIGISVKPAPPAQRNADKMPTTTAAAAGSGITAARAMPSSAPPLSTSPTNNHRRYKKMTTRIGPVDSSFRDPPPCISTCTKSPTLPVKS